jgi:hypothetical protein
MKSKPRGERNYYFRDRKKYKMPKIAKIIIVRRLCEHIAI